MRVFADRSKLHLGRRTTATVIVGLLTGAAAALAIAPWLMPESYSAVEHAVSESAGQGVENAWLARTGFLLLGFAVLLIADAAGSKWSVAGRTLHRIYGVAMIAAAAYSHMPWEDVPYDRFEDLLHSVAASVVGMSFVMGVLVVSIGRLPNQIRPRMFDWFAITASMAISLMMFTFVDYAGAMQRFMFGIGIVWYALETIRWRQAHPTGSEEIEQVVPTGPRPFERY